MTAGSGMKDIQALIPIVGDEVVSAEDHTTLCGGEEPVYRRYEAEYAHRERKRGTKNLSISKCNSYNNEQPTTFTKGYKVTLYSD